jgi:energy-coupling factor transporter ATP-binding protein EcfA2
LLKQLQLINFRSFPNFKITFGDGAYLVGPNNAGKSTILTALRTADVLVRFAQRRNATLRRLHGNRNFLAYPIILNEFPALEQSVHYEFDSTVEARFELTWQSGARLVAVWQKPFPDEPPDNFFYLENIPGLQPRDVTSVRSSFPLLGVIPILTPLDVEEERLTDDYVLNSISTRLSSRHFRNQLRLMKADGTFDDFSRYIEPWLEGFEFAYFDHHPGDRNNSILDVYYREQGSRVARELAWAGDGIQVWLQILYHVYRTRQRETLILDEPEVYLHPDLQRKLVYLLEETGRQPIVATHSSEMAAEADPKLVIIVDKSRRSARRARDDSDLELLSTALGTAFNLRLAKALRSRVALFVEGQDMTVLRRFAKTLGLPLLSAGTAVTTIPLNGYSRWSQVSPFAWLCQNLFPEALIVFVVLDHDYRPKQLSEEIESAFEAEGIVAHVWQRKELESYLLTPSVISRISGASEKVVTNLLDQITLAMESDVFGQMLTECIKVEKSATRHESVVMASFKTEFDGLWGNLRFRLDSCPAKDVIAELNNRLKEAGYRTVSRRSLTSQHRVGEIPSEMTAFLNRVEAAAETGRVPDVDSVQ